MSNFRQDNFYKALANKDFTRNNDISLNLGLIMNRIDNNFNFIKYKFIVYKIRFTLDDILIL